MPTLAPQSINLILADLPYGATENKWDVRLPLEPLWAQYKRLLAPGGVVVLTAQQPFSSVLVASNPRWFRYAWVWDKHLVTGFFNAKKQPLRRHEDILIFAPRGRGGMTYNPQFSEGKPYRSRPGAPSTNYRTTKRLPTENDGRRYPVSIISIPNTRAGGHPTQKPVPLFEYLISTYSNEGDVVLDNVMGSGTAGVACRNTGRRFIGIERESKYFDLAAQRLGAAAA